MATDAVVHDDFGTGRLGADGLTLGAGDEIGHMLHAVDSLEAVVGHDVAVGHMAVVARGVATVRRPRPRGIVRGHDMTVDTGGGVVAGDIGVHSQ